MNPSSFLITHPHSSIHPSCLLRPPLHFLNSSSFSHLFTLPLFTHIFTLLPFRQSLHPRIHPLHPSSSSYCSASSFFSFSQSADITSSATASAFASTCVY